MNPRYCFCYLRFRFFLSFAMMLLFAASVRGQISVPDFTPPPEKKPTTAKPSLEAQAAKRQAPMSLVQKEITPAQIKEIRLSALTATEQATESKQKKTRIGILRPMPNRAQKLADYSRFAQPNGTLYLLRVASPQALSLRLHFAGIALPEGATLFVYSRTKPETFAGPYNSQTMTEDLWTPSLMGEEIIVELFIPASIKLNAIPFRIDAVSHIYRNPRTMISATQSQQPGTEAAGDCEQEVPAEWQSKANAVGLIAFVKTDGEYACSGTLLTDIKKTRTPFFLTANHCIGNNQEANSSEVYWFFDRGEEPTYAPTRGSRVLVTDIGDDYTLLELNPVPSGVTYSGWTTAPPDLGTAVTTIHHPQASHKRFSSGQIVEASCPAEIPPEFCNFYTKVRWTSGITEPGSSGGGLFVGPANDSRLIGVLSGGESACDNSSGIDWYPRFNRMFGAIGYYLTNGELCRYTLLQDQFLYHASGGKGEITIVPKIGGENCPWQARSNVDWITITSETSGTALGKLTVQVAANPSNQQRLGAISIAGRNVLMVQNPAEALTGTCAPANLEPNQLITGNLNASACRSWFDLSMPALRYVFEGEAGQPISLNFQLSLAHIQLRVIGPDGVVTPFGTSYGIVLKASGTQILEIARVPTSFQPPGEFSFTLYKGCGVKLSPTYFEVDGFGQLLSGPPGPLRIATEATSSGCTVTGVGVSADEPIIDENKLHGVYNATEKAVFINVAGAVDPKRRYIVVRIAGQPVIIRQLPRCSSTSTFAYTPSELNLPGTGGQFQMQIKRTAGPSCSWEIKPFEITGSGQRETRDVLMQPENYGNWALGTDDGVVTYKLPTNQYFRNNRFVLQNNGQVAQTILQTFVGGTCARTSLQVGQAVNGQLTTSDCSWLEAGQYVDVYQITLAEGEQYAIEMTGTAGAEISAEQGIMEYGSLGTVADFRQKASFRSPETGFYNVYTPGTYLLRVFGKPGTYQVKIVGIGPAGCVYKINKEQTNYVVPANTTSYSVKLDCNRGDCDWTAQSSASWVTFPQGTSGTGSQMMTLALAPNTGAKREATLTIAGRIFYLTQDFSCTYRQYNTAAPNKFFASMQGGEYRYWVTTGAACPTPAMTSSADWLQGIAQPDQIRLFITANPGSFRKGTITIAGEVFEVLQGGNDVAVTTAADYQHTVAPGSLVTVFHQGMSAVTEAAQTVPLPTQLANTIVYVGRPGEAVTLPQLLYVSPTQINFYLPESVPTGRLKIQIASGALWIGNSGTNLYATGEFDVTAIAPNVFSADSSGKGPAAANIQRIRPGQPVLYEDVAVLTTDEQGKPMFVARPVTIGSGEEKTYLVLYATGLRKRNTSIPVTAQIGDVTLPVEYAGPQGQFVGLDQINILLPPSLRGKGLVNVTVTMEDKTTNPVQIHLAP